MDTGFLMDKKTFLIFLMVWFSGFIISSPADNLKIKFSAGFLVIILIHILGLERCSDEVNLKAFNITAVTYPVIEVLLRASIGFIDPLAVNIAEHFLAGAAVASVISVASWGTLKKLNLNERFLFLSCLAIVICLLYELIGYLLYYEPTAALYSDTMRDLVMNIAGSATLSVIILALNKKHGARESADEGTSGT